MNCPPLQHSLLLILINLNLVERHHLKMYILTLCIYLVVDKHQNKKYQIHYLRLLVGVPVLYSNTKSTTIINWSITYIILSHSYIYAFRIGRKFLRLCSYLYYVENNFVSDLSRDNIFV